MAIKDFFKNVGTGVKNAANKATQKIDDTVDVQKLKYRISKKEDEIKALYQSLGEAVVNAVYAEEDFDETIATAIAKLEELKEEIKAMEEERLKKEKKIKCPVCGAETSMTTEFCSKCGEKLRTEEPDDTIDTEEFPSDSTTETPTEPVE